MRGRPITIERVKGGYYVFVNDVPVVETEDGKVGIDRVAAGIGKSNPKQHIAPDAPYYLFTNADAAKGVAHQIGRYMLNLGDFVFSYVQLVNVKNPDRFWG